MKRYLRLLLLSTAVFAQNERLAEVQGQVMDMLGRPMAGALVVYTNVANGKTYRTQTDRNGKFDMIGLIVADSYQVEITGPDGRHIYSGKKPAYGLDKQALNVIYIDLSLVPTKASLAPFKGPTSEEIQGAAWRNVTEATLGDLTPEQRAELRAENAAIVHYNELAPETQAAIKTQNWPLAAELLQRLIAIAPYQWQLYQNLGIMQRNLHLYQEAVQSLEKGIEVVDYDDSIKKERHKRSATVAQMLIGEGEAYSALDQPDTAAALYRKAAEIDPKPALAYMHLCIAEYHGGNAEAALAACATGIAADPRQPEFYQILAGIEGNLEKYEDAIRVYERGILLAKRKIEFDKISTHSNINPTVMTPGHQVEGLYAANADRMLSAAEERSYYKSRAGQMLLAEGNAYFQLRKYNQAADLFAQAATMHDYPALAYFNLCVTRFDMNDLQAAVDACDRAIAADPQMAEAYFVKASALLGESAKRGNFKIPEASISALEKYLQLAPDGAYATEANSLLQAINRRH
ncbi:MAG TPA: tetratricopeptide repeat protein [Candidatus Angelobacter sp.]